MFVYRDTRKAIGILHAHDIKTHPGVDSMLFIDLTRTAPNLDPQKLRLKA
jgi:hypothetical protein